MPETGAELAARVKPRLREESTNLCLRPDLLDEHEALEAALREERAAWESKPKRNAEKPPAKLVKMAERLTEVEDELLRTQVRVTMRALPKDEYQALCDRHKPRPGDQYDAMAGYNRDAVTEAAMHKGMADPVFEDCHDLACDHAECGSWQWFTSLLNPSEWNELKRLVSSVNRVVHDGPKSVLASRILASAGGTSRQRAVGE